MKKLFLLLALLGMVVIGCSKDDADKGNDNKTEQPNENEGGSEDNIPENIFFGLDKESVTISPDGGSVDVIVYSNYKWEISGTSDWCTPSVKDGDANEDGQKVTFSADVTYDDREATFWFRCADEKIKFVVSQKLKEVIIPDANNTFNIPAEGGVAVISYQTTVDCDVIIPEEAQDWITIAPATRGLVSENINLDISENTTYSARTAVIKVVAKDNAELAIEYTINQEQNDAVLADENNTFTVPSAGGEVVINYQANIDCDVIIPEEAQDWITIVPATRGLVSESITLNVAENTTYSARTAVVKVVAKGNAELVVECTINQEQNDAILSDENNTFTVPSVGGEVVINYQANIDCDVIIPEEAQDWITIVPATRGLVSESITLNIAENTTYSVRTAVIKVVAKDNAEIFVKYTINQGQKNGVLVDGNNTFTVPSIGGSMLIKYQANVDCDVIIPEEAQDWITIAPATRGLVSESITLNIAENTTYSARTAVVKVVAKDNAELVVEYTINQEQNNAILADKNNTFTVPSTGGEVAINYQTNIDCEVIIPEEAQDWIAIAPATRGLVSESITLNIAENTTYSARTAVIKVVAKDNAELVVEYTINQEQKNGVLVDGNNTFNVYGAGGSVVIKYQANVDCDVIIPDEAQDWVAIAPATRGLSTYSTTLNIAENNSGKERSCVVKLASQGDNELSAEYIIIQKPRYCLYYTSNDGKIVQPYRSSAFGATIISNTYIDGVGTIDFNAPITTIGSSAFRSCSSLTSVTIPDSVTTIGDDAFEGCSSLTSVTIGDSVTSIGDYAFWCCSSLTSVYINDIAAWCNISFGDLNSNPLKYAHNLYLNNELVTDLVIPDSVTTIGKWAFYVCSSLTSVTIPDSVTTIGEEAFLGCESLTSVTIPDSVTTIGEEAFSYCSSLTSVYIDDIATWCNISFSGLGSNPLYYADNLYLNNELVTDLVIPDSVTTIGNYTFDSCSSLTSVTIGDNVTSIGEMAFYYCYSLKSVTIPNSVTEIGERALADCYGLTSVTIGDNVTSIGEMAFYNCSSLKSINIPESVTSIGKKVFYNCTGELIVNCNIPSASSSEYGTFYGSKFTKVTIGNCVTSIGDYAFYGCTSLKSITISDSVTSIGCSAFENCDSLTTVTIGNDVTSIGEMAFKNCDSLTSINIPESVTSIGKEVFYGCTGELIINSKIVETDYTYSYPSYNGWLKEAKFTKLTIGDSVTKIGNKVFYLCSSLTSVTIPDSVTTIGNEALSSCSSLTSVTIPDSVTTIGGWAFCGCDSLTSVYCKATTPPAGGYDMFDYNALCRTIYVPMESVKKYKSASYWSEYKYDIFGYNF